MIGLSCIIGGRQPPLAVVGQPPPGCPFNCPSI
jgi:hypothetical protein